jgi:hypothetical protein
VIYINELPYITKSETYLFADDTKIFRPISSHLDQKTLQEDLLAIKRWMEDWLFPLNESKCKLMHKGQQAAEYDYHLTNGSTPIAQFQEEKDLGVIVDNQLSFEQHIAKQVSKANI